MTNEVRKPREFSAQPDSIHTGQWTFISTPASNGNDFNGIHPKIIQLREVLPGDDSIRVSRKDWCLIKAKCGREPEVLYDELLRIERENPPKQDEGK